MHFADVGKLVVGGWSTSIAIAIIELELIITVMTRNLS